MLILKLTRNTPVKIGPIINKLLVLKVHKLPFVNTMSVFETDSGNSMT